MACSRIKALGPSLCPFSDCWRGYLVALPIRRVMLTAGSGRYGHSPAVPQSCCVERCSAHAGGAGIVAAMVPVCSVSAVSVRLAPVVPAEVPILAAVQRDDVQPGACCSRAKGCVFKATRPMHTAPGDDEEWLCVGFGFGNKTLQLVQLRGSSESKHLAGP